MEKAKKQSITTESTKTKLLRAPNVMAMKKRKKRMEEEKSLESEREKCEDIQVGISFGPGVVVVLFV